MIYNNRIAKEVYHKNLTDRSLKQKGVFKEKNKWIAFDNSTEDLFVEEFSSEIDALFWLNKLFEYSEKSDFKYFRILNNLYYSQKKGLIRVVRNFNTTKLVY